MVSPISDMAVNGCSLLGSNKRGEINGAEQECYTAPLHMIVNVTILLRVLPLTKLKTKCGVVRLSSVTYLCRGREPDVKKKSASVLLTPEQYSQLPMGLYQ